MINLKTVLISFLIIIFISVVSCESNKDTNNDSSGISENNDNMEEAVDVGVDNENVDDYFDSGDTGDLTPDYDDGNNGSSDFDNDVDDTQDDIDNYVDNGDPQTDNGIDDGDTEENCNDVDIDVFDNFPNEHQGLRWSALFQLSWEDANAYCENLGGRLPSISELRTLIQNCPATEPRGECGVIDDCTSGYTDCWNQSCHGCAYDISGKYSVFGDIGYLWSSSFFEENHNKFAWYVDFEHASVDRIVSAPFWFRCVEND